MIESIHVIGAAASARPSPPASPSAGFSLDRDEAEFVLICVPDRAIAEVARGITPGPGSATSAAPRRWRRSSLTYGASACIRCRPSRDDGARSSSTAPLPPSAAETDEAREIASLARTHAGPAALRPRRRPPRGLPRGRGDRVQLPRHAAPGSRFSARGRRRAAGGPRPTDAPDDRERLRADRTDRARRLGDGRAPPRGHPRRTPGAGGGVPRARRPHCAPDRTVAELAREHVPDDRRRCARSSRAAAAASSGSSRRWARCTKATSRLLRAARAECDTVVMSLFVNPAQFGDPADLNGYPRDEAHDLAAAAARRRRRRLRPERRRDVPARLPDLGRGRPRSARSSKETCRPGHFRGVATVCLKLFAVVRPDRVYFGQKDAQQVEVIRRLIRDLALEIELRVAPDGAGRRRAGALLAQRPPLPRRARARSRPPPRPRRRAIPPRALALLAEQGLDVDYVEVAPFDPPVLAAAVRVGSTRLIDNVPLRGDDDR